MRPLGSCSSWTSLPNKTLLALIITSLSAEAYAVTAQELNSLAAPPLYNDRTTAEASSEKARRDENVLIRREETVGSSCSSEGQWNCMTDSWQRCASGQWSQVINCAAGTICTPSGLTNDFHVEADGSSSSSSGHGGGSGASDGLSRGPRGQAKGKFLGIVLSIWAVVAAVLLA